MILPPGLPFSTLLGLGLGIPTDLKLHVVSAICFSTLLAVERSVLHLRRTLKSSEDVVLVHLPLSF